MPRSPATVDAEFEPGRRWLASRLLSNDPRLKHASTTRRLAQDASERLALAERLNETLGWSARAICMAEQTHGDGVAVIRQAELDPIPPGGNTLLPGVDALVSDAPGVMLAIFTADCVPILFADARAGVLGAVHAGWRGTIQGVLPRALQTAFQLGADPDRTRLWIAPAISGAEYEVSPDLAAQFMQRFPAWAEDVIRNNHVELPEINRLEALACGLRPALVGTSGICVKTQADDFFSYRREGPEAGRMVSAIIRLA